MFGVVINEQGFKVTFVLLNDDKIPKYYQLKEGENIIEKEWSIANGMNKPRWDGEKWIDTEPLPQQEPLPPQEPIDPQPSRVDILEKKVADIEVMNANLLLEIAMLKQNNY